MSGVRKFGKCLLYALAGFLGLVLVALGIVILALERVPAYQDEIKARVFRQTGLHVAFTHVSPSLRWYGPELLFDDLELRSHDDHRVLARAASGRIGTDIRQIIRSGDVFAGRIELVSPDLTVVRVGPHSFALAAEIELNRETSAEAITLDDLPAGTLEIRAGRIALQNWNPALPQLLLERVNLVLRRNSDSVGFQVDARLPQVLGGNVAASGVAQGLAPGTTPAWNGNLEANGISFAGWRQLMPDTLGNLNSGEGQLTLNAVGHGVDLAHAQLDFVAHAIETHIDAGVTAKFDEVSGLFTLDHVKDGWTLSGRHVLTRSAQHKDPPSDFDVSWRGGEAGLVELRARASYLRVDALLPLASLLPQHDVRDRLLAVAPTGVWSDAYLELARAAVADPWALRVQARFKEAGTAAIGAFPGFRGLSGELAGNQSGGHVRLDCESLLMAWPAHWLQPVSFDSLKGTLYWKRTPDSLLVASKSIEARNPDGAVHAQAALQIPQDGSSPQLTVVAGVDNGNVASAHFYAPRGVIGAQALAWLDQAFIAGHLSHADVVLQGNLLQFPFRDGGGTFLARATLDGVVLNYADGWPLIEDMAGVAEFRNQGMSMHLTGARTLGLHVSGGEAHFADFKDAELQISAQGDGDALEAIKFLRATPLDALTGGAFSGVDGNGAISGKVELFLPFKDFERRRVLVHAKLGGVSLTRPGLPLVATELRGNFDIDGGPVAFADIRGQLLGGPVRVTAKAPRQRPLMRTQLDLRGSFSGDALRAALGLSPALGLRGAAEWQGTLVIAQPPGQERLLHVSSSLIGIDSQLPDPLRKPPARPLAATLDLDWPASGGTQVAVSLGAVAQFRLAFEPGAGEQRLTHVAVMFGDGDPTFADNQLLNLGGHIERLGLSGWQALLSGDKGARPLSYYLHDARLVVDRVDAIGLSFRKVGVTLSRVTDHWRLALDGPNVDGTVLVPADDVEPWDLQFRHLRADDGDDGASDGPSAATSAAAAEPSVASASSIGPGSVPALKVRIDELNFGDRHLGDVHATVSRAADGVKLDQLTIDSPSFNVKAQGDWHGKEAGTGHLAGTLHSSDVGTTLIQLGYANIMTARTGRLDFNVNWTGAPSAASLRESVGHLQVALDRGQVYGISPGAGRLLGLASVAELPRRLALDFSDLTDKGLAFDTVRGDFELRGGDAYTDNMLLKGPAAEIGLIGRVGLKNRDYDQTAVVTGSVGNSLPLAAFAGGPVIGAAVLLFTQVFKQPLRGLARGYYRITGSWDSPTVERITGAEAAAANAEVAK